MALAKPLEDPMGYLNQLRGTPELGAGDLANRTS
jgi:hypothetical protein